MEGFRPLVRISCGAVFNFAIKYENDPDAYLHPPYDYAILINVPSGGDRAAFIK
jgi:hypothetical protein